MKAAVYHGLGKPLLVEDYPDPEPGPEQLLIKVHRCGICGTDLHMTSGHGWDFPNGTIPGHEYAGEVIEIGSKVSGYKKGDLITALPSNGCGHCDACYSGNITLCRNAPGVMGGYAELLCVPSSSAIKLPSTVSLADGALVEPLAIALYGVRMSHIQPGDNVLVLGAGSVALCAIYWARRLGAGKIVVMSRSSHRASMALAMGADTFVQYGDNEAEDLIQALGTAPNIVFECVGAPGFIAKGIEHVRPLGQVISMGFCTAPDSFSPAIAGMKGVSLQFPVGYSLKDFQYVVDVMNAGHVDPKILITSVVGLNDLPSMFERLRSPNTETKVHIVPC